MKREYFFKRRLSFKYAINGIVYALSTQQNLIIHLIATLAVVIASFIFRLTTIEWTVILLTISSVWITELFNTAFEKTVDLVTTDHHPLAKIAKDVAAGAVLFSALSSVIVGLLIFLPKLISLL